MPPSLSMMQGWKLREAISKMPPHEKEIAERIYKHWDYLTISSNERCFSFMMPLGIAGALNALISPFFGLKPGDDAEILLIMWAVLSMICYGIYFLNFERFRPKRMIESMPQTKAEFEKILEEPGAKEVFEKMKQVFNGTSDL